MRVRYDGDIPVGVPGVPIDWTPGLEAEVSADTGAYLLRNIHFHEVVPEPVPPVEAAPEPTPEPVPEPTPEPEPVPPEPVVAPEQEIQTPGSTEETPRED